jgi:hypothetical protein
MKKGAGVAMKNENRMTFGRLPRVAAAATVVVGLIASAGPAGAWSLEEASAPYKGTTIRTIGEALPPLEARNVAATISYFSRTASWGGSWPMAI